jgi:uncharacterized protein (DUF58 family)
MRYTASSLLGKVRQLEIRTRHRSSQLLTGGYQSRFHGRGMSFSEVREYTPGDDVKTIDWNVTARMRTPYVKVFEEERELIVVLVVDVSASSVFGTRIRTKDELIAETGASILLSAAANGDRTGLILFSDRIELYVPPKRGKKHVMRILRELVAISERSPRPQTNIGVALKFLNQVQRRRSIAFVMSDFDAPAYDQELLATAHRHDTVGIRIWDEAERVLPDAGLITLQDAETGTRYRIDSSDVQTRAAYSRGYTERERYTESVFRHCGVPLLALGTAEDPVRLLQNFFQSR